MAPPFILESFALGVISIALFLGLYALIVSRHWTRCLALQVLGALCAYGVLVTHWVLEQHSIRELLLGNIFDDGGHSRDRASDSMPPPMKLEIFVLDSLFPLVTETVLFAISTTLALMAWYALQQNKTLRIYSGQTVLAACMYIVALIHWIVSITTFCSAHALMDRDTDAAIMDEAPFTLIGSFHHIAPVVLLSMNIVMSDAIVLWRVVVLWEKGRRPDVVITAIAMLGLTIALTITNLVSILKVDQSKLQNMFTPNYFAESLTTGIQSGDFFGLLALAASLGSNIVATCLVGNKAWRYRRQIVERFRHGVSRTMAERVVGLLVESGALYCVVWVLYIIANLAPIPTDGVPGLHLVDHLNVALAQLTSIYPTLIIILVALERSYCDRHCIHDLPLCDSAQPVSVTIALNVARSASSSDIRRMESSQIPGASYSRVNLQETESEKPEIEVVARTPTDSVLDLR
ncbi:unnamed protein product [Peniophora sp. CBMAI 1063]|nr:unnamed protein product [Peniophora sp. CBMAI 1063]